MITPHVARARPARARRFALATAAVLTLTGGLTTASASAAHSSGLAIATTTPLPSSLCGSDEGDDVDQSMDGDFTACLRVPDVASRSVAVALQTVVSGVPSSTGPTTTTVAPPAPPGESITLSLSSATVEPGAEVVVAGRLSEPVTQEQRSANLCWDGCDGLQEQGVLVHWSSPTAFRMTLRVPETAWLVSADDGVSVHALTSGSYEVGVQCLTSISGCALEAPEAQIAVRLKAPRPTRCLAGERCATMTLSTTTARIGDVVLLRGWAPVQSVIGRPFSYSLALAPVSTARSYPSLTFAPLEKANDFDVELTPRTLNVEPSVTWAQMGRVHYDSSTFSGASTTATSSGSDLVAWCRPTGIVITGGSRSAAVATLAARSALAGTSLKIPSPAPAAPQCVDVQLDPSFSDSVFAGFEAEEGDSMPPIYQAPLYTTDAGRSWHVVPVPDGLSLEDFAGFVHAGGRMEAMFESPGGETGRDVPQGTDHGLVVVESTADGGASWTPSTLGCPSSGPCVGFGPYEWGNCNMSVDLQPLLVGPPGVSAATGVRWTDSSWVTTVDSCFSQQLVVSSARELFLLDPSSQYPLLESSDAGHAWSYRALPRISAASYGLDSVPLGNSLVLSPDGSLFEVVTTQTGSRQELFRLYPSATSWCQVPRALGMSTAASGEVGALRVGGAELLWNQTTTKSTGEESVSFHARPYTSLNC